MKILAIDSSAGLSVALCDDSTLVAEITRNDHGVQGELAADFVSQVLDQAGWSVDDITDVVVGVGPGPYTGLRVGIVTATVFAHARKIPVHPVCSLDAIGFSYGKECIAVTDARRKELYWAHYVDGIRQGDPMVSKPLDLLSMHSTAAFIGPGALLYPEVISGVETTLNSSSLAQAFALGKAHEVELAPMYLRKPDADEPAPRKQVL